MRLATQKAGMDLRRWPDEREEGNRAGSAPYDSLGLSHQLSFLHPVRQDCPYNDKEGILFLAARSHPQEHRSHPRRQVKPGNYGEKPYHGNGEMR